MDGEKFNVQSRTKAFKSKKSTFSYIFLGLYIAYPLLFVYAVLSKEFNENTLWPNLMLIGLCILNIWDFYTSKYYIKGNFLESKSLALSSEIDINSIFEIKKDKYSFLKPGVFIAGKGTLIKYGKNRELMINPESSAEFIQELKKINPEINITKA